MRGLRHACGTLPHDAVEAKQGQVAQRRAERADAVGDEANREAKCRVCPASRPSETVVSEGLRGDWSGAEGLVVPQPPAHPQAQYSVGGAHLDAADLLRALG